MFKYFFMFILGIIFTFIVIMLYAVIKVSSNCTRKEEKEDYGKTVYRELEKREKMKNDK